jgi:Flp pilus assembly protein TadD
LICLLAAGCSSATQLATESASKTDGASRPDTERLIRLADDVEARGDYDTSAALLARAAETSGSTEARLRLGKAQLKIGDYAGASAAFTRVLATDADNPEALLGLGTAQLKLGDPESSARTLALACPRVNTAIAYNRLGTSLAMLGRLDEALEAFQHAQSLAPNDLDIDVNVALAQALSGHSEEAVATMQRVVQSPLAQPRHRANLVMVLGIAGRADEAKAINLPDMSPAQKRDLLARAKKVHDTADPLAKVRAVGLLNAA